MPDIYHMPNEGLYFELQDLSGPVRKALVVGQLTGAHSGGPTDRRIDQKTLDRGRLGGLLFQRCLCSTTYRMAVDRTQTAGRIHKVDPP